MSDGIHKIYAVSRLAREQRLAFRLYMVVGSTHKSIRHLRI